MSERQSKLGKTVATVFNLENSIMGFYNHAMKTHMLRERFNEDENRYMEGDQYKKLPRWAQSQLHGYENAMWTRFYDWLEDRWRLDGKLYTRGEERELAFEGRWPEVEYVGKFYPGTDIQFC